MQDTSQNIRQTTTLTRYLILLASLLVLVVFLDLFLMTEKTDQYFAWTINPPLTAAFIGAGYGAAFFLEFMAYRKRTWAEASIAIYGVIAFSFLILIATVMHRDRFHFDADTWYNTLGTWFWLAIYAGVPILLSVAVFDQWQQPGSDPAPQNPIQRPLRLFLVLHSLLTIQVGVLLFIAPEQTATVWAWTLTPLTARAIGSWLVGIGVTILQSARVGDWDRTRYAMYSYLIFVSLLVIAVLRYSSSIQWDEIQIWLFWGLWLAPLLAIGYGWFTARK